MFARGWTPLDEDVHFPPAWFAKISKLRTVGSEMPHTTWGKDGWITFNYDVMQFISDANPSYGTDIVFLVCPCTVPRGPLMWATIYQGRKMFQRTSEQGGVPADVVELLKMSPYRPNLIVMDGRIYIWLRVNYMPLPQRFSELSAGKRSDSVDEGTASQARPRYGDCRPDAVGWQSRPFGAHLRTQTERQRCATIHIGRATLRGMATSRPRPESRLPRAWR